MQFSQVKFQDPATKAYLGSPSIIRLEDGDLLVSHDYFGPGCPRNHEDEEHLTSIYRSSDEGRTWVNVTHIANQYWSGLFRHRGAVYILGTSQQYGSIVIRRSDDDGSTWMRVVDSRSGLLFRGGPYHDPPNYHTSAVPVLEANGRLYRAFEDCTPCEWGTGFQALVISAPADADLLDAASWTMSNRLPYDPATYGGQGAFSRPGWLEGNMVQAPDGTLWNMLRFNSAPLVDRAAMVRVSDDGRRIGFDPTSGFVEFPGGMSKFVIRRDGQTGIFLTITNNNTDPRYPRQRNILSLCCSNDLRHWRQLQTLLTDDSPLSYEESQSLVGFQYADWQFDGDDLICVVRTAYCGAHNYHDANRITFHRVSGFRRLLPQATES